MLHICGKGRHAAAWWLSCPQQDTSRSPSTWVQHRLPHKAVLQAHLQYWGSWQSQDILRPTRVKCWQIMVILFFCHGLKMIEVPSAFDFCPQSRSRKRFFLDVCLAIVAWVGSGVSLRCGLHSWPIFISTSPFLSTNWGGIDWWLPSLSCIFFHVCRFCIGPWSMMVHELRPLLRQWRKRGRWSCTRSKPDFHQCQAPHCCNMLQYPPILVQICANTSSSQHCDQLIWICCCQQSHPEPSDGVICRVGAGACPQVMGWAISLAQIWNGMATEQPYVYNGEHQKTVYWKICIKRLEEWDKLGFAQPQATGRFL